MQITKKHYWQVWKTKEKLTSFWWLLWKVIYLFKGKESKFFFRLKVWLKCFVIFDYIWDSLDMKLPKPIAEHNWSTLSWKPLKIIIIFTGWRLELDLQYFPLAEQNSVRDNLRIFLARNHFSPQIVQYMPLYYKIITNLAKRLSSIFTHCCSTIICCNESNSRSRDVYHQRFNT